MADETITIKVKTALDTADSAKSLNDIKKSIKDLKSTALEVGESGAGFKQLTEEANRLQDKLDDLKDSATSLKGTGVEKLTSSFNLLKESFSGGDIDKAKIAFKGLGSAMSAIPIFLLIEGVKLLIDNFQEVIKFVKDLGFFTSESEKEIQKLNKSLEQTQKLNKTLIPELENRIKLLEAEGASSEKLLKAKNDLFNAQKKELEIQVKINIEKAKEILQNYDLEEQYLIQSANVAQALGKEKEAEIFRAAANVSRKKRAEEAIQSAKEGIQAIKDINTEAQVEQIKVDKAETKNAKEKSDELKKIQAERNAQTIVDLEKFGKQLQDVIDKNFEQEKKDEKEAKDKAREDELDSDDSFYARKHAKAIKNAQNALIGDADNLTKKRKLLDEQRQEEIRIAQQTGEDIAAINKKYAIADEKLVEDSFKNKINKINQYVQAASSALNNILGAFQAYAELQRQNEAQDTKERQEKLDTDITYLEDTRKKEVAREGLTAQQKEDINYMYAQKEYQLRLEEYNKSTEIKKKAFEQNKQLQIAQAVVNTIAGSVAALTSALSSSIGYPYNLILGVASAAAVAASGAFQIAAISKQKFDAGSPPTAPTLNIASGGQFSENQTAMEGPSLKRVGRSDAETTDENSDGSSHRMGQPTRAYVVSSDITSAQDKEAILERRSSF